MSQKVTLNDLSCLSRREKEKIATCFEQNDACHVALETAVTPPPNPTSIQTRIIYLLIGGALGAFVVSRIK